MNGKELWQLYTVFFRIGGLTFGGGLTMLPMLKYELIEKKDWVTEDELLDYYAVGQCTPGIIAVNTATFVGRKVRGTSGAIVATLALVLPSLLIISALAGVIEAFSHIVWVQHAFGGIRVCVCVLIINGVVKLYKKAVIDIPTLIIFLTVVLGSLLLPVNTVVFVVLAAIAGIVLKVMGGKKA